MFTAQDLLRVASRDYILGNVTPEELIGFIDDQIADPFGASDDNYLRRLSKMTSSQDELDEHIIGFITGVQDVYPHLVIDHSEYDQHLIDLFKPIYKFFVRSIRSIMYIFIREFIFSPRNRKELANEYINSKLPNYPKEQYGKKEYYILVTKLPQIIGDIFDDDIKLTKFMDYVERGADAPVYLETLKDYMDQGYIIDNGVCKDLWKRYKDTDAFRSDLNRLEMEITTGLIIPYLEENNMISIRLPITEPVEEAPDISDDEEDD